MVSRPWLVQSTKYGMWFPHTRPLILHPSSLILHPSSFILYPSSFILSLAP